MALALALVTAASALGLGTPAARAADYIAANHTASNGCPYYIMVNRAMNTVTVYGLGKDGYYTVPVKAMICSVGRSGHSTPTGTFSLGNKQEWCLMVDGSYGQYSSRIHNSYLFHSVCYSKADPATLMTYEYNMLGSPASLGCVRLQTADAKWIFDNCAAGTKVTIYDGTSPGPLGKPERAVDYISAEQDNGWDPTDPRENNPWRRLLVSGVWVSESAVTMTAGEKRTLSASATPSTATIPGRQITWSSGNPSVATVDSQGNVIAMGPGSTEITASCGKARGSCTVKVTGSLLPFTDVKPGATPP